MSLYLFVILSIVVSIIHSWALYVCIRNDRKAHQGKVSLCGRVITFAVTVSMFGLLTIIYIQNVETEAVSHETLWEMLENTSRTPLADRIIELELNK